MVPAYRPPGIPFWLKPIRVNTRDLREELNKYLDRRTGKLARWLYSTWNAEREAVKYQEIRNAIKTGQIPVEWFLQWQQDYARFIVEVLDPEWRRAMDTSAGLIREAVPGLEWNPAGERIRQWIEQRSTELAVNLTEMQHRALRAILRRYAIDMPGAVTVDELSRLMRAVIGLTHKEALAVDNFRRSLLEQGLDAEQAEHQAQNYAGWLHRRRAMRIARTELAFAFNFGHFEAMRQAVDQNLFGSGTRVIKRFSTAEDERVCPYCGPLDGITIGLDETFPGATKRLPAVYVPPLHPHCRCSVEYEVLVPAEEAQAR